MVRKWQICCQYLHEVCKLNFSKSRCQSYDSAANMYGRNKEVQKIVLKQTNLQTAVKMRLISSLQYSCSVHLKFVVYILNYTYMVTKIF